MKSEKVSRKAGVNEGAGARSDAGQVELGDHEAELKLEVDLADLDVLLSSTLLGGSDAAASLQDTVYFDTPDEALRKAGFSLRVRKVGERRVQTQKAQGEATAGLFVRPEWEREIVGDVPVLDDGDGPLRSLIPASELQRLEPIFQVKLTRTLNLLERPEASVELVLDHGEVLVGDRSAPVCEIELELKRGNPAALFNLARELDHIAPMRLGVLTKSERGYRLAACAADKAVKAEPLALQPGLTTAAGVQAIVGACVRQFRLNEAILTRTGDPAALHQARVALRRLRSALSTFKSVVEDDRYEHLRAELRWIAAELGQARNLDVLLERVTNKQAAKPLKAARKEAYAAVSAALASARVRALLIDLSEWTAIGSWISDPIAVSPCAEPLEVFAAEALERHRRRLKRRGRGLERLSDDERHEARIEAKKLRYATEFFATLFPGKKARRRQTAFREALEGLQEHLGDLNDLATAPVVLAELRLAGTSTADALQPDMSARGPLIERAADAYATLMDVKRFWR